jgi:hypothetical protein
MKRGRDGMLRLIVCSLAGIFQQACLWHRCNMSQVVQLIEQGIVLILVVMVVVVKAEVVVIMVGVAIAAVAVAVIVIVL